MGKSICNALLWPAFSLVSQQNAEAIDNNSPPSSRHTNDILVAEVRWPEVWVCLFNIGYWRVWLTLGQMDPISPLFWQFQSKHSGRKLEVSLLWSTSSSSRWVGSSLEPYNREQPLWNMDNVCINTQCCKCCSNQRPLHLWLSNENQALNQIPPSDSDSKGSCFLTTVII